MSRYPLRCWPAVVGALLSVLVPAVLIPAAPAVAGTCPNEALRTGPSAHLPDCRAYEQVTPVDKEGGEFEGVLAGMSPDGTPDVMLESITAIDGIENDFGIEGADYTTERTESGWVTTPLAGSAGEYQAANAPGHIRPVLDWSLDGRATAWLERSDTQPDNRLDLYILRPGGVAEDVGPVTPPGSPAATPTEAADRVGIENVSVSDDASHVLFTMRPETGSGFHLWPGDNTDALAESLYEYVGVGNTTPMLVGVDDEGELISRCGTILGAAGLPSNTHNAISADGNTVFFTAQACGGSPAVNELFARVDNGLPGAHTVAISEPSSADCSACDTSEAALQSANFEGASEDGSKVFFTTSQPLLEGVTGDNLYEYDFDAPPGERVVRVSAGDATVSTPTANVEGVVQVSEDGSHVYFVATGALTTKPNILGQVAHTGANNLYVYERDAQYPSGRIAFIADLADSDKVERQWLTDSDVTPDGRFLVFASTTERLTPDDTSTPTPMIEGFSSTVTPNQMFEYDAQTGDLVRISIGQDGYNNNGNTDFAEAGFPWAGYTLNFAPTAYWSTMSVSANGSYVFFESTDALTPQAFDNKVVAVEEGDEGSGNIYTYYAHNIYEYHDGNVYLISDGRDLYRFVRLLGTDESGADVFFQTSDPLVPQDIDTNLDVYDARIDGGFPAPAPAPVCSGDACQGPLSPAPTLLAPGSEFQAGANVALSPSSAPPREAKTKAKAKKKKKGRKDAGKRRSRKAGRTSSTGGYGRKGGPRS